MATKTATKKMDIDGILRRIVTGPSEEQLRQTLPRRDKKKEAAERRSRSPIVSVIGWGLAAVLAIFVAFTVMLVQQDPQNVAMWATLWIFAGLAIMVVGYLLNLMPTSSKGLLQAVATWTLGLLVLAFVGPLIINPNIVVAIIAAFFLMFFIPVAYRYSTLVKLHHEGFRV